MPSVRAATDTSTALIVPRGESASTGETPSHASADFSTALAAVHAHGMMHHAPERRDDARPRDAGSGDPRDDEGGASATPSPHAAPTSAPGAQTSTTGAPAPVRAGHAVTPKDGAPPAPIAAPSAGHGSIVLPITGSAVAATTLPGAVAAESHGALACGTATADAAAVAASGPAAAAGREVAPGASDPGAVDTVAVAADGARQDGGVDARAAGAEHAKRGDGSAGLPNAPTIAADAASIAAAKVAEPSSATGPSTNATTAAADAQHGAAAADDATKAPAEGGSASATGAGVSGESDTAAVSGGATSASATAAGATTADAAGEGDDVDTTTSARSGSRARSQTATKEETPAAAESRAVGRSTAAPHAIVAGGDAHPRREGASLRRHAGAPDAHAGSDASGADGPDHASAEFAASGERGRVARAAESVREQRSDGPTGATARRATDLSAERAPVSTATPPGATADHDRVAPDVDLGWRPMSAPASARDATGALGVTADGTPTPRRGADASISPWAERVVEAVRVATLRGGGEMRLRLEPAGLGHIDIRITLAHDGIRAAIVAEHDTTRTLLRSEQHLLHAALERSELRLAGFSVDVGSGASTGAFAERRDGAMALGRDAASPGENDASAEQVATGAMHAPATPGHLSVRV